LPTVHKFKKNKKDLFVSIVERHVVSLLLSGEELYDVVSKYGDIIFGFQSIKEKFSSFGLIHN
jgi:hypothetical protein